MLMRKLLGCSSILLLFTTVFLILLARGPGFGDLADLSGLEPLIGGLAQNLNPSSPVEGQPPTLAQPAATAPSPTAAPLPPTETAPPPTSTPASAVPRTPTPAPGNIALTVRVHGPAGEALDTVIDGNVVALTAGVTNPTQAVIAATVSFGLTPGTAFASCPIEVQPGGQASCTVGTAADGWAWQDHQPVGRRMVYATLVGQGISTAVEVLVRPKPVVLVHGFTGSPATWQAWTGPNGFLARWGIAGYAVGDGQFGIEPMDTGEVTQPGRPTRTIAENAQIVARYVEAVRAATGAGRIDLVAHSMGGLMARYYVSHYMPIVERQDLPAVPVVNQLYMIGTPNAGTPCAIPPAVLGLYSPATTQLTPAYVQGVFNPQTKDHRGVPFFVLAGDPVRDLAALVCTPIPTDAFVSVASAAGAIPAAAQTMPVRHGEQTGSLAVFTAVLQSLTRGPEDYPIPMPTAPALAPPDFAAFQISLVSSGTLPQDGTATVPVAVDEARQASFQLYAPGQDVELTVVSSVGQEITAETVKTAPDMSMERTEEREGAPTQGFKVRKPEAGQWQLVLKPRPGIKAEGAFYAVAAFLQSDLRLAVETASPIVAPGQPVVIHAILSGPVALGTAAASATVRNAPGEVVGQVPLFDDGAHDDGTAGDGVFGGVWEPAAAGLYSLAVTASGQTAAGNAFQRIGLLAVEVR